MKRTFQITSALLAITACLLAISAVANADSKSPASKITSVNDGEGFKLIHVSDLQNAIAANSNAVHIYDANTEKTRKEDGLIPGAVALSSSSQYDTKSTLPSDINAQLVFYCANTQCMASHGAAKRAVSAGYKNVSVMADGIQGWKKAGLKTQSL